MKCNYVASRLSIGGNFKAFQEGTTDAEARTALGRLRQRVQEATDIPSPKAKAALAIVAELERLLET